MKKNIFALTILALLLVSCQTKNSAISNLRSLNQEIQVNGQYYSVDEWKKAGKEFVKINKQISEHAQEYSEAELQEIAKINGECSRSFAEGAKNKLTGIGSMLKSFVEGFIKTDE